VYLSVGIDLLALGAVKVVYDGAPPRSRCTAHWTRTLPLRGNMSGAPPAGWGTAPFASKQQRSSIDDPPFK
jgi:hypothetical protein